MFKPADYVLNVCVKNTDRIHVKTSPGDAPLLAVPSGGPAPLQPTSVTSVSVAKSAAPVSKVSALDDLDALGQSLLQSSLPANFKPTPLPRFAVKYNMLSWNIYLKY